jgi:hypothetical protein
MEALVIFFVAVVALSLFANRFGCDSRFDTRSEIQL